MSGDRGSREGSKIPVAEWAAAAVGAALFVTVIAVLLVDAARHEAPPRLAARVERIAPDGASWRVEFVVENQGDRAAEQVTVHLAGGAGEMTVDFIPGHSRRRGGFILERDPGDRPPRIEVVGYLSP